MGLAERFRAALEAVLRAVLAAGRAAFTAGSPSGVPAGSCIAVAASWVNCLVSAPHHCTGSTMAPAASPSPAGDWPALRARGDAASADDWAAEAAASDELGLQDVDRAWQRALALAPERHDLRDRYAAWLEREERYDDAIRELEWLRRRSPAGSYQARYDGAKHARGLVREIRGE